MRARGIRSYHRPGRLEDALALLAQGAVPLGGGTRLLAQAGDVPNLLDLQALELGGITLEDGDLFLGASVTLQDVLDSEAAHTATAGLLPQACRAQAPSRLARGMATVAGEAVHGAPDSAVAAALLALNAVFVIAHPQEPRESPALRFVPRPEEDLRGGGLVQRILIPGAPDGAALEFASVLPSAPPLALVAVTVAYSHETCSRARIAVGGLAGRPQRVLEAEAQVERTSANDGALERAAAEAARLADVPGEDEATVAYRRRLVHVLTRRALERALGQARDTSPRPRPRLRGRAAPRAQRPLAYFTSGKVEITVNGRMLRAEAEARTTLVDVLRRAGLRGTREACGTGECGACTVLLDGRPVLACLTLAVRAHGRSLLTVEGLGGPRGASAIPAAFASQDAFHCGFCTPAQQLRTKALLDGTKEPSEEDALDAMAAVDCACLGPDRSQAAALAAAARKARA